MKLTEIADNPGARKSRRRVGRGIGSGKGKTAGRGFKNVWAKTLNEVNLGRIQQAIDAGKLDPAAPIDVAALVKAGVLRRAKDGVRLLGDGEIKAKVALTVYGASKSAAAAVEKAGGSITVLAPKREGDEKAA